MRSDPHNCVAAFQIQEDKANLRWQSVAEAKNPRALPDARKIAAAVRNYLNVEVAVISIISAACDPENEFGKDHAS